MGKGMMGEIPFKLGRREIEVLSALEYWGILGLGQIDGLIFKKYQHRVERIGWFFNETDASVYSGYAYKRLLRLERAGLIKAMSFVNFPKLYCLAARGHRELTMLGKARLPSFRRTISPALVRHELLVNAVGLTMSEVLGLDVRSELFRIGGRMASKNLARQRRRIFPDLWIVDKEHPKAIEVELRQKSRGRYKELWREYPGCVPYNTSVLYLTGWPGGRDRLIRYAGDFRSDYVHVADIADFRGRLESCRFVGQYKHRIITLKRGITNAG